MPSIDVVIPTWNGSRLLSDCLDAIEADPTPHRTIVVDNGSDDDTLAMLAERHPDVTVVALPENVGFGAAVNRGVAAGRGEVVVLLNNDANVLPGFLEEITAPLHADPGVGMVAGVLRIHDTDLVDAAGVEVDRGLAGFSFLAGTPVGEIESRDFTRLLGPCGGAGAYRRTVFEAVGGLDEELFAYSEDVDIALRIRGEGWRCAPAPRAQADHVGSATFGLRSVGQTRIAARSRGYMLGRWRVGPAWVAQELGVGAVDALVLRSAAPLTERIGGLRRGGALPARRAAPDALAPAMGWWPSLRRRRDVVRGYERRRAR